MSETLLCYFVTFLAREGLAPASIQSVVPGRLFPPQTTADPDRDQKNSGPPTSPPRLPITPPLLRQIHPHCLLITPGHDKLLLWAAATTCFFGFFRAGEITVPSAATFDPAIHLAWGHVAISEDRRMVRVYQKRAKTDQFGRGTEVFFESTDDELCPVRALVSYVAQRVAAPSPFFCTATGGALTKVRFVKQVRSAMARAGIPLTGYSGHSFRIVAATAASQAGVPDSFRPSADGRAPLPSLYPHASGGS